MPNRMSKAIVNFFTLGVVLCGWTMLGSGCDKDDDDAPADKDRSDAAVDAGDGGSKLCSGDRECSDGLYCNGIEQCDPGSKRADDRGCVSAATKPCGEGETCDEETDECVACTDDADVDGDNHEAIACGGDDCDDADPNRYPGNAEVCDPEDHDEDCNPETFGNRDVDNDGSYDAQCCNRAEDGSEYCGDDCDDTTFVRHPSQLEICDSIDNDCDGETDEDNNEVPWYPDSDGDNYGVDTEDPTISCSPVDAHSLKNTDCDDDNAAVHPAQLDICDQIDNDCDGETDDDVSCDFALTGTVGADGGEVSHRVRGFTAIGVQLPRGAVQQEVEIEIEEVATPLALPEGFEASGPAFLFSTDSGSFGKSLIVFLPVVADAARDVAVLKLPADKEGDWEQVESVQRQASVLQLEVENLGYFQVVIDTLDSSDEDAGPDSGMDAGIDADDTSGLSDNANLAGLTVSEGTLSPEFAESATSYAVNVENDVTSLTVTPVASDANASIEVDGNAVSSGDASAAISLDVGISVITIAVTAEDGATTQTYKVRVWRQSESCPSTIAFGVTISCSIDAQSEMDSYTFSASADDIVLVRMIDNASNGMTDSFHPTIRLLNPDGSTNCETSASVSAEIPNCTLPTTGTYRILAFDNSGTHTGDYGLHLQRLNNPGNTTSIELGETLSGFVSETAQIDAFTFSADADDAVLIRSTDRSGNGLTNSFHPHIRLYNPDGTLNCEEEASVTAEISSCVLPTEGTYTILIFDDLGTHIQDYSLYLQRLNN